MPDRDVPVRRILVVEDHPVSQRVATVMLENLGCQVDVVGDGAGAVRRATETSYDAILMDCQIPLIDGYQATAAIRHLQGATRRTPIIAVTASDTESERERCLGADMDDHVTKPLSLKTLGAVLARWAGESDEPFTGEIPEPRAATRVARTEEPATRPVLDAAIVDRLERVGRAAGEDLMGQLTNLFLADAGARIAAVRDALGDNDAAAVARAAHTLTGASANLGATELARLCASLAKHGAAGDLTDGAAALQAIEAELAAVRAALDSLAPAS